jgi:hypothetical protein
MSLFLRHVYLGNWRGVAGYLEEYVEIPGNQLGKVIERRNVQAKQDTVQESGGKARSLPLLGPIANICHSEILPDIFLFLLPLQARYHSSCPIPIPSLFHPSQNGEVIRCYPLDFSILFFRCEFRSPDIRRQRFEEDGDGETKQVVICRHGWTITIDAFPSIWRWSF